MKATRTKTKVSMSLEQTKEAVAKLPVPSDCPEYVEASKVLAELRADADSRRAALAEAEQRRTVRSIDAEAEAELSGGTATATNVTVTPERLAELRHAVDVADKKIELQEKKVQDILTAFAGPATEKALGLYTEASEQWCSALVRFVELNELVLSIRRHYAAHGLSYGNRFQGSGAGWLGTLRTGRARASLKHAQEHGFASDIELPDANPVA